MLKRFLSYYGPHRFLFFIDILVALLSSGLAILIPSMVRTLLQDLIPSRNVDAMILYFALMAGIYLAKMVFEFIRMKWGHILGVRMDYDMREDIFRHIQKLSFNYFDNTKTGHIMSRISNDLNTIAEVAHHAPEDLILSVFLIVGSFFFMSRTRRTRWAGLCPDPPSLHAPVGHPLRGQDAQGFPPGSAEDRRHQQRGRELGAGHPRGEVLRQRRA